MDRPIHRVVDLIDQESQQIFNMEVDEARELLLREDATSLMELLGSFALTARQGEVVRMARSLDRPMRYFLAKQESGPLLVVADRIDQIRKFLEAEGYGDQFHPSYTRMVPAHHVTSIRLIGCPDPNPIYQRFLEPAADTLQADVDLIGERYVRALWQALDSWLQVVPPREPIGVLFSGGLDSGSVLLCLYSLLLERGHSPSRLKAFTLAVDGLGSDATQAREFLRRLYKKEDVFMAHPEMLSKSIGPDTKVVGINVMDPLGMAPVTTTMSPEKLSYVAMKFKRMCADIIQLKKKYDFKVVVGGNGAWELAKSDRMKIHGIDTVVVGEADELAVDLFQDLEKNDAPELMHCFVRNLENIPVIEGPTINSLIEAMRGCGRGCDFCDVNKRSKKDLPLERLQHEAKVNLDYGFDSIWLHSDEMLLYGCDNRDFVPNRDAIVDLWKGLKGLGANFVGTTHMTFSAVAADPTLMQQISHINGQDRTGRWLATNLGIETVSPAMVKKHLGVKTKPFAPEEWGSVVIEGAKILNGNHWFPPTTL